MLLSYRDELTYYREKAAELEVLLGKRKWALNDMRDPSATLDAITSRLKTFFEELLENGLADLSENLLSEELSEQLATSPEFLQIQADYHEPLILVSGSVLEDPMSLDVIVRGKTSPSDDINARILYTQRDNRILKIEQIS
jgi:hypothetical protein